MNEFSTELAGALRLVVTGDPELWEVIALSLRVSLSAVVIAAAIGLPVGALVGVRRLPFHGAIVVFLNTLMGLPPVVVGLVVYLALSASGPLGPLQLLYTPTAMIIAQVLLVAPIIAALTRQVVADLNAEYEEQFRSFGISVWRSIPALLWDGRFTLVTVLMAGFGRAIAEVGAVLIVGGNINHVTRVMTTTIALETSRGNLSLALALGCVLVLLALAVNAAAALVNLAGERWAGA